MRQKTPSVRPTSPHLAAEPDAASGSEPRATSLFVERLALRLARLCEATGLRAAAAESADRVLRELIVPWSRVESFARNPGGVWISEISDDNTPVEFSVTLSTTGNEVRVLFEPQGEEPTLQSHRAAALQMHEWLEQNYGADLTRLRSVQHLFAPPDMLGPFALWSAVVFTNHEPPAFKAYLNPQAQGPGSAVALVQEGLRRLGLKRAWHQLARTMARRGPHLDELKYFALDLSRSNQARVKVYVRHHEASPEDLAVAAAASPGALDSADFARAMGGGARRFNERATFTCAAFVGGEDDRPAAITQYVPVCAYAFDDSVVEQRVARYLLEHGLDDVPYKRMLAAFAMRPLDAGVGLQSWIAFRRYRGVPRLTVYLSTESRCVFPPGCVPAATREHMQFASVPELVSAVQRYSLAEHPVVRSIGLFAESRARLWLLINNAAELLTATTGSCSPRLATWQSDNHEVEATLSSSELACRHALVEALREGAEHQRLGSVAERTARIVAARAAFDLASDLTRRLMVEQGSTVNLSLGGILRAELDAETPLLAPFEQLDGEMSAATIAAFGVHRRLWLALDRIAEAVERS